MPRQITMQVGSTPHYSHREAMKYSSKHDVLWLPECIHLGDSMREYIKHPGQLSCLELFRDMAEGRDIVKVQCIGPVTLFGGLRANEDDKITDEEYEALKAQALDIISRHKIELFSYLNVPQIIQIEDEPGLGSTLLPFERCRELLDISFEMTDTFTSAEVIKGIHTCGNAWWDDLLTYDTIDIISFDASKYGEALVTSPEYRNGKRIAWGIERLEDVIDFREGDLLTLPCGMGPDEYKVSDCQPKLDMLNKAAETLARQIA